MLGLKHSFALSLSSIFEFCVACCFTESVDILVNLLREVLKMICIVTFVTNVIFS